MNKKQKKTLYRIVGTGIIAAILMALKLEDPLNFILMMVPYLLIGYDIIIKAFKGIKNLQPFDENFLMTVATLGAMILGEHIEGVAVMFFYQIGELFQSYAVGKSRRNISELMDIRPDYANVEVLNDEGVPTGELERVDPYDVEIGRVIVVKAGEKIPIDGIVIEGNSTLNTAALTGESLPRDVFSGYEVISGSVNINGLLKIRTTKEFGDSTASKILDMVENAGNKKSKSEKFISKFAKIYTPIVCILALLLAIAPPLFNLISQNPPLWGQWIYRALTFLVISCPCALVVSVPLGFFAGIGGASKAGVLVKGANYLETLSKVKTVVFDKTGTLTQGVFDVAGIHHGVLDTETLLEYTALVESYSNHPIAVSIAKAYHETSGKALDKTKLIDIKEVSGQGVIGKIKDESGILDFAAGNEKLMAALGIENVIHCRSVGTLVHLAINGEYGGHILISDMEKPESKDTIKLLKKIGIKDTIMLTGDIKAVGEKVGKDLGLDKVFSQLLPQDKVAKVEELLGAKKGNDAIAFVGDGINDAPVLTRADVGIAMGALGSDAAIEAADIVLMDDNPMNIVKAIKIANKAMRIIYENIYFAIGIKLLCLVLGAVGIANMWFAIFADVGVLVLAVLNAIRTLSVRKM